MYHIIYMILIINWLKHFHIYQELLRKSPLSSLALWVIMQQGRLQ